MWLVIEADVGDGGGGVVAVVIAEVVVVVAAAAVVADGCSFVPLLFTTFSLSASRRTDAAMFGLC